MRIHGKRWLGHAAILLGALGACGTIAPIAAGKEVMQDGVLHVVNGAEPTQGRRVVQLQEVWRAGGEDSEDIFGMVSQVTVADDGTVYLLDTQLAEVPVYSPAGERLTTLSRQGDGPGETRLPSNLVFMPDGTLGICQIFPGKITKITRDGSPAGVFEAGGGDPTKGGFLQMFDCVVHGQDVIVCAESIAQNGQTGQKRTNFIASFDLAGNEQVRFWETVRELDFTRFEWDEDKIDRVDYRKVAVGRDGRVYIANERNRYAIHVHLPDGSLDRVIERAYEHRPREQSEIQRLRDALAAQLQQLPDPKIAISNTEPDIAAVHFGPDSNLWVNTSRSGHEQPDGVFFTWDVFTPDGVFVEQVAAACPGDGDEDMMIWTPSGNAVQVTGFTDAVRSLQGGAAAEDAGTEETAPMEVIYYRPTGS